MSWSVSTVLNHESGDVGLQKDLDALNALVPTGQNYAGAEVDEQFQTAKSAAFQIIVEGGFSNSAEEISVSLSGHANEGHKNPEGQSNEYIAVNVYVKKYRE